MYKRQLKVVVHVVLEHQSLKVVALQDFLEQGALEVDLRFLDFLDSLLVVLQEIWQDHLLILSLQSGILVVENQQDKQMSRQVLELVVVFLVVLLVLH